MKNQKKILLIINGNTHPAVQKNFGNTVSHFKKATIGLAVLHEYAVFDEKAAQAPNPAEFDGVIMSGSSSMLDENLPWMQTSKNLVQKCLDSEIPFLGVCFGHQILGSVCGARVGPNPSGRASGSCLAKITKKARIFDSLPNTLSVQISHRDVILEDHPNFEVIATAKHDKRHSIQVGASAFGVQFHPEWDIHISRAYIDARRDVFGDEVAAKLRATLADSAACVQVIRNFVHMCGE